MAETVEKSPKKKPNEEKIFGAICGQAHTVTWLCAIAKMTGAQSWVEVQPEHVKALLELYPSREAFGRVAEDFVLAMYPKENKAPHVCNLRGSIRIAMRSMELILYGPEEKTSKAAMPALKHLP